MNAIEPVNAHKLQKEVTAISKVAEALSAFDEQTEGEAIQRVLDWACAHFGVERRGGTHQRSQARDGVAAGTEELADGSREFDDIADLMQAASPKSGPDRALVVGFWLQNGEGHKEFGSQAVNSILKDLGHGLTNVTDTLTSLMRRKPQLVIQTKKRGTSKQARKQYRLTAAGIEAVRSMCGTE